MTAAIVLLGHGSRDPGWREPMDAVAARIRARDPHRPVECAFLELQPPALAEAVDQLVSDGATSVTVLPMFLGLGRHAREDLPMLLQECRRRHPAVPIQALASAGEEPRLLDLLTELACARGSTS